MTTIHSSPRNHLVWGPSLPTAPQENQAHRISCKLRQEAAAKGFPLPHEHMKPKHMPLQDNYGQHFLPHACPSPAFPS